MNKNTHGHIMPEQRRQRWALRKLSVGMCSVLLGFAVMIPTVPAVGAAEIFAVSDVGTANAGVKELDTSSHFTATGVLDSSLRYASTVYNKVDATGKIMLTMTKWADGSTGWATNKNNEFAGKYLLYFSNDTFYKEIESITIDGVELEQKDEGALWMVPITSIPKYALIGVVTNHDVTITLKDGKTLTDLGLADKAVSFGSVWIQNDGTIASESISNGYILENNPNIKNEKEAGFTAGQMTQKVMFDINSMSLKSVHTFKPNENYIQSDYGWVIYVKEQIPTELLQYIDRDNITIYNSDLSGKLNSGRKTFTVSMDDNGRVDTSNTPELSIVGRDTKDQLSTARDNTNDIFWGTLGQSRNYTISYQLKDGVSVADFAKAMNDYVQKQQARVLFDHWMEADYLNESNQQILHKPDHGAPPKQLTGSYSNAYLDTNDTDKDGLFDFVEWQIKTDSTDVDTDGDGVPDGQEFLDDNTLPNDASDYLPSKPLTDVTAYDGSKDVTVTGTVSKPLIADPSDTSKLLQITDAAAGNVTVKLQAYDEASNSYTDTTYGTATIPFADLVTGNFSINVGANTIPDGTKVVLVSYSPNGKHAVMGDPLSFSVPDKDKYNANGGTVNQDYGTKAKEQDILDAVTVTETKGGQEVPVSADKIQQKAIKGTIPEPSADGSDQTVTVEVTYADGSKEEATVTISYGEAKDKYAPVGQE
ncbi:MAG: YSIRK-type signal peptide-containing protein, partial [Acutalibacteraceae bacterium]